ncbi:ricin-type beta-trefoil lectin domain protein [Sesbania bispinosa]|nr:ricin-type beta-trefoil lectin domain protein [Sesbania bispinosa]
MKLGQEIPGVFHIFYGSDFELLCLINYMTIHRSSGNVVITKKGQLEQNMNVLQGSYTNLFHYLNKWEIISKDVVNPFGPSASVGRAHYKGTRRPWELLVKQPRMKEGRPNNVGRSVLPVKIKIQVRSG